MAGIIENFKLDMADDNNITFAEAGKVITLIVRHFQIHNGNPATQRVVNAFAKMIQTNRAAAETQFLEYHKHFAEISEEVRGIKAARQAKRHEAALRAYQRFLGYM